MAAEAAIKDLAEYEKKAIGTEERSKHAATKVKKLTKSIKEVRTSLTSRRVVTCF